MSNWTKFLENKQGKIRNYVSESSFLLIMILLFALALRLIYYVGILRGDSVSYAFYAYLMSDGNMDILNEPHTHYSGLNRPGLYAPASIFIKIFGASEFSAVLFPLLASLVTCYFIFKLASGLANKKAGLIAALLWAVFPLDIFMATQLDPEGPLALTTAGSVYFLTLGNSKGKAFQKILFYALSAIFVIWAFQIKPSSLPIIFVLFALFLQRYWEELAFFFTKIAKSYKIVWRTVQIVGVLAVTLFAGFMLDQQPWPLIVNSSELSAYDVSPAWLLGRTNPISREDVGGVNYFSTERDLITPPASPNVLTESTPKNRLFVFDVLVPVFVIAAAYAVIAKRRKYYLPLIWFGILFFYLEWGAFPRSFNSEKLFYYLPISHWISADNFLFLSIPLILVVSLFLAERINESKIRQTVSIALISALATVYFLGNPATSESILNFFGATLVFAFSVGFYGAGNIAEIKTKGQLQNYLFSFLLIMIAISAIKPSKQYHVTGFLKEQERRENLEATVSYLADQPDYPIYSGEGPINRLNLRSEFEYGYFAIVNDFNYPETRFSDDLALIQEIGGYTIHYGCGQPIHDFANWPTAEFGNPGTDFCISLQRYLPKSEIDAELILAMKSAESAASVENINRYIAASASSNDLSSFVDAVSHMVSISPEHQSVLQASGVIKNYGLGLADNRVTDLIASYSPDESNKWDFGERLEPNKISQDGTDILQIEIEKPTQEVQTISIDLSLRSNTAYILEIELLSFAPYDLVRFSNATIPDSYVDSWNRSLSWTSHEIVFVTPSFIGPEAEVSLELARVFDRGDIQFRKINLIEIVPNE